MARSHALVRSLALVGAAGIVATGFAACGSSSSSGSSSAASTAASSTPTTGTATTGTSTSAAKAATTASTVAVTLGKPNAFSLVPSPTSAKAGKVTFKVDNAGTMTHELVVLKTDTPAKDLKVTNGKADETGNIGETGDMKAGTSKSFTVDMTAGHYVLLCNLPGHYQGGMYKDFTVS